MKYINEKRMRIGYIVIFGLAVAMIGGALYGVSNHQEGVVNWFISALGGLLLFAVLLFIATELVLQDALDLRPRPHATAIDSEGLPIRVAVPASEREYPSMKSTWAERTEYPATKSNSTDVPNMSNAPSGPRANAAPLGGPIGTTASFHSPPPASSFSGRIAAAATEHSDAWAPKRYAAGTRPKGPTIAIPAPVIVHAKPETSKQNVNHLPKPDVIPEPPHGVSTIPLTFEIGNAQFRVPRGARGQRPGAVLESTRILCSSCGLYFRADLDRARPQSVPCPQCSKDLGLSGATQTVEHVKMRCRHCGDFLAMPKVADHKQTQCSTCGQING